MFQAEGNLVAPFLIGLGSSFTHCSGMCLPIHLVVQKQTLHSVALILFHLSRIVGYALISTVLFLGVKGLHFFSSDSYNGIFLSITVALYIVFGLWYLKWLPFDPEKIFQKFFPAQSYKKVMIKKGVRWMIPLGLMNSMLPCPSSFALFLWVLNTENVNAALAGSFLFGVGTLPVFAVTLHRLFADKVLGSLIFQRSLGVYFLVLSAWKVYQFQINATMTCH